MRSRRDTGTALIQALVIVAALSALAAALLIRTQDARLRLFAGQNAAQAGAYLDAGVAQAMDELRQHRARGVLLSGQIWAQRREGVEIDRGTLAWQARDLQARFNVNSLSRDGARGARAQSTFRRLAQIHGLSRESIDAIVATLQSGAGPLIHPAQLRPLVSDSEAGFPAFMAQLAALPVQTRLNLNTVPADLLAAYAPELSSSTRDAVIAARSSSEFTDEAALLAWAETRLDQDQAAALGSLPWRFSSQWFEIQLETRLDTMGLRRTVIVDLENTPTPIWLSLPD